MFISEIENKKVKVGMASITVKNENGKTSGVVRNIRSFKALLPRLPQDIWKRLRDSGIWGSGYCDNIVESDGQLYYLHDLWKDENYYQFMDTFKDCDFLQNEIDCFNKRQEIKNKAEQCGIKVISCYLM